MSWFKRTRKPGELRPERCPVCKTAFGTRCWDKRKEFYCKECTTTFTFHPYESKPTALTDKQADQRCGCSSCDYRDGVNQQDGTPEWPPRFL